MNFITNFAEKTNAEFMISVASALRPLCRLVPLLVAAMLCLSCSKDSDNGLLDGVWQLQSVHDRVADPDASHTDRIASRTYFYIQLNLLEVHSAGYLFNDTNELMMRFARFGNDSLRIYNVYRHTPTTDTLMDETEIPSLRPIGLTGAETRFAIRELSSKGMVLENDEVTLRFKKF